MINILTHFSCGEKEKKSEPVIVNNIFFENDSTTLYSGKISSLLRGKKIEYDIKNGKKNGQFKIFYANGKLEMSGFMKDNLNDGLWKYFYPSGKIESKGYFVNDQAEGKWKWYYENGKLKEEGAYEKGNRIGNWKIYSMEGQLLERKNFDKEKPQSEK